MFKILQDQISTINIYIVTNIQNIIAQILLKAKITFLNFSNLTINYTILN